MIYGWNSKEWDFLIVGFKYITFGLVRQCDENAHDAQKDLTN